MRKVLKATGTLVVVAAIGGALYVYQVPVKQVALQAYARFFPCAMPITYRIGSMDPRFEVSQARFLADIEAAADIWESGSGRKLFEYDQQSGAVAVNLVYDYRQQAIDQLTSIGITIDDTKASYDQLKAKYDSIHSTYDSRKASLEAAIADLQRRQDAYNQVVQTWNARGGAPKDVYNRLQSEKAVLNSERAQILAQQKAFNSDVDTMNALATQLNRLASALNISVDKYNTVGASTGGEFEEGIYESSLGIQKIDIFEFGNRGELVRVLAHELGHALGLQHVSDPQAIMYKLNQSTNSKTTEDDLSELARVCGSQ